MAGVETVEVEASGDGQRLDKWLFARFPGLTVGRIGKLCRTGQVRVDGGRVKPGHRLAAGMAVRLPPLDDARQAKAPPPAPKTDDKTAAALLDRVLYRDAAVLVLDKPPGLAVQGGSGTTRHVDGALDALRFGAAERPKLVHRLDKNTSGVLVLGRTAAAARALTAAFRHRDARKIYWALTVGVPDPMEGRIDAPLDKAPGARGEKMAVVEGGKPAQTDFATLDRAGRRAAFVALWPRTGRTHQLRVHLAQVLETPILGDGKYGGRTAFLDDLGIAGRRLHLHARAIDLPHPSGGRLTATAPLPPAMREAWQALGFATEAADPFS